jgi:hypothetical protein
MHRILTSLWSVELAALGFIDRFHVLSYAEPLGT